MLLICAQDGRLTQPGVQYCTYSKAKQWTFQTLVARIADKAPVVVAASPPAKTKTSTRSSDDRHAPRTTSAWSFPMADTRAVWPLWFLGNPSAPPAFASPLRLFKHDVVPAAWRHHLSDARRVVTLVLDACLSVHRRLVAVFYAFPRFLGAQLDGLLTRLESWTYAKAITYNVTSFQRRLAAARSDDDSSTAEDEIETMASPELLVVFDGTFGVALDTDDDGMLMRRGFKNFALDQVGQMKFTFVLRRLEMMPPCASPTRNKKNCVCLH
ncbi:Aste57867_22277 [Aphanomyces stellatus]|uniref:Aste57867_22277 protein n=1 Tax=Aphanomyces stellatus TaxID=120398 RepID=A0A485LL57_9STRA|nr:hypothetical protein As57867_022207 [Aphanomyces stellatus]VFT98943.1 Aste57867_22277 [Aphanomyces stellatus]